MARSKKSKTDQNQMMLDLFKDFVQTLSLEGGSQDNLSDFEFRFRQSLKALLDGAAKRNENPMDRFEIAAQMSRLLGREITKSHLDQWAAMSTVQRRIHVDALKALSEVTGDWSSLKLFAESCGFRLMTPEEAVCAEYGAKMLLKKMIDSDIKDVLAGADESSLRRMLIGRLGGGAE